MMSKKIVIVGGVAGGASAAARLRRLDEAAEIVIIERGEHISFANCGLPYYVGGVINKRQSLLVQTPRAMHKRFNIDVRTHHEAISIHPQDKTLEVRELLTGETYVEKYDYLILSPGAHPIIPDIPGINLPNVFTVRNVPDSDLIKDFVTVRQPAAAAIIGAGFIGLEMAEALHQSGVNTTVIESAAQVMGALDPEMAAFLHQYLRRQNVNLILNDKVVALKGSSRVEGVELQSGQFIAADMAVLGIGVAPEVALAEAAGLALGSSGGILVNDGLQTSDPNIYAVGDAIQVKDFVTGKAALVPLAGPANKQGRLAADHICGRQARYNGTQGTAILKFMDMVVAVTGSNEKRLGQQGINYLACHTHPAPHATYYPGSSQMSMKVLFTPGEGKLLGAQIVGYEGVDKRIDVLATAIRAGMTVFDLKELELAYAPPFSSAKDPVNMIGYVASNIIDHDIDIVYWHQVPSLAAEGAFLIDVRTAKEYESGAVEGAHNIPLDEIRLHLQDIPQDRPVLTYCQVGLRSYMAARILKQKGYQVRNISGGFKLFQAIS
jgi:NADPH-dependent 2,4-dienoyl-CoA reductase/sulfur reductase-like enzyme/rhodanese-related sulfurtransferase